MKLAALLFGLSLAVVGGFADSYDYQQVSDGFTTVAGGVAGGLVFNSTIGSIIADPYIGQLLDFPPHLALGASVGFTTIPYESLRPLIDSLDVSLSEDLSGLRDIGLPLPGAAFTLRLGGVLVPMDVGFKALFIPNELKASFPPEVDVDYTQAGVDVRLPLVYNRRRPNQTRLSVAAGLNYVLGSVAVRDMLPASLSLTDFLVPATNQNGQPGDPLAYDSHELGFTSPTAVVEWESTSFDLRAQIGRRVLFLFHPFVGAGVAYGVSNVAGALRGPLTLDGATPSSTQTTSITNAFQNAGLTPPALTASGLRLEAREECPGSYRFPT